MTGGPEAIGDLLYSDTERALSESLVSLLADRGGLDKALARAESGQTYDDALWSAVGSTDGHIAVEIRAGEAELFGRAVRQMRDGGRDDITAPAIFQRHGNAKSHAKIADLLGLGKSAHT